MKKTSLLFVIAIISQTALCQTQTFDLATYTPPLGWTNEIKDFAASYTKTNNKTKSWCRITIYKSIKSSGDPAVDYASEWNALMVKNKWGSPTPPSPETETEDGWTSNSGFSVFAFENKDAYSLLSTISGYGVELSIVVLMNSQEYSQEVEKMLGSLSLTKPEGQPIANNNETKIVEQSVAHIPITNSAPGSHGISISTTTFDDGWVAQPFADWVRVTKNQTTVLLHFAVQITDELRNTNDIEATLFDQFIMPRYNVANIRKNQNDSYCYFCIYFFEADAVEKATGKRVHLGFRIITTNGISRCIEIISPSATVFQQEFTDQKKLEAMLNYNKFAVASADLIGQWDVSSGSQVDMYNTVTGSYAGMNFSSSATSFTFNADGTYSSRHSGAFGMVSNTKFYDQKYNGNYTVTNWDITATKQFEGKTKVFWAQFEAVRGGRVLNLTQKEATAMNYHLVKTK
jgi:hypothetical protein